jgi:hypothetical protein
MMIINYSKFHESQFFGTYKYLMEVFILTFYRLFLRHLIIFTPVVKYNVLILILN